MMKRYLLIFAPPVLLALLVFSPVALSQKENLPPVLASLVEAERSFSRASNEKGISQSFYEYFAEDGINFQPHPVNTRESIRKEPAQTTPATVKLHWEPSLADVSRAGDMGYTTGPLLVTDLSPQNRPARHGVYFSVWKKQADGSWKVVIDAGIRTPTAASPIPASVHNPGPSEFKQKSSKVNLEQERAALVSLEREFMKAAKSGGVMKAFQSFISPDARLHRNGMLPLTGKDSFSSYFATKETGLEWEPIKADVAQSNDLGYTYGSYEVKGEGAGAAALEKGYYVRVWKRNKEGAWKLVLDTTSPIPPEKKSAP
jgi:ketosteroid isomerase-like protein